jgi:hypothetical protein
MKSRIGIGLMLGFLVPSTSGAQVPATHVVKIVDEEIAPVIHLLAQPSQVHTGQIEKKAPIASIPYAYNRPVRLTQDYKLNGATSVIHAGTMGFALGSMQQQNGVDYQAYCVFGATKDNPYSKPMCFMADFTVLFGKPKMAVFDVSSNIQTYSTGVLRLVKPAEIEFTDAKIDHDFHIDLSFKRWFRNIQGVLGIVVYFKSEDHIVEENFLAVDGDNILRLQASDGIITLKIDPADQDHVIVGFIKSPT